VGQCNNSSFIYSDGILTYLEGSYANGINNLGQIVGWNGNEGYLYSNGTYTAIQYPGAWLTVAYGINDNGVIVGSYQVSEYSEQQHGFLYSNGVYTSVDYPGAASTNLTGINNAGEMVGAFCTAGCRASHGFLVNGSNYERIDYPGAQGTAVYGINNNGVLVGGYSNEIGFIYENGNFESVDYRSSPDTAFWGINDRGEFVGYWLDAYHNFHGLLGYLQHP
jgi:probable HAF family extracellular repeat protein